MAIPCIALHYRHITLFQRDCCIYERVPFCTTTYCKSHHTQPDSFTRTAVCIEGYLSKRTLFQRDCCIYERVPFCTTTYCKSHHLITQHFSKEQYAYPGKTFHISLCRELCQEDAVLLGDKMKSSVNQKCCFLLFMLAIKTCNIEANTTLSFEHGATRQNWIFSLIFTG